MTLTMNANFCIFCAGGDGSPMLYQKCPQCEYVICPACHEEGRGCINKGSCDAQLIADCKQQWTEQRSYYPYAFTAPRNWPHYVRKRDVSRSLLSTIYRALLTVCRTLLPSRLAAGK